jgi:hypothetical protein
MKSHLVCLSVCVCLCERACFLGKRWRDGGEKERNGGFLWLMFFCEQRMHCCGVAGGAM